MKRVKLKIYGKVQAVLFRDSASKEAKKRELVGFVRNASDGTVEVIAEGSEKDLKDFIVWCYNGPERAVVAGIQEDWSEATGEFFTFMIKS